MITLSRDMKSMVAKIFTASLSAAAAILFSAPAHSATIENLDAAAVMVVIVEGDSRFEHLIPAKQEISDVCSSSCSVYVGSDTEPYDLVAADKVEIEKGELFYTEQPQPPATN